MSDQTEKELATSPEPETSPKTRPVTGWRWAVSVASVLSSVFLFALDTTVVANVQANIVQDLGEIDKLPWLGAAFVLPAAALQLPWTKAYGLLNLKWLYIAHVVVFEAGSALAGASPTMNAMVVGRAIAGIGGAGMYVGGITYFNVTTTPNERPIYVSLISPVWGLGTVLGPIGPQVGGAFADSSATWRWGFYINLVIFAISAPAMLLTLPSIDLGAGLGWRERARQFDWLGCLVFCGWCISFIMAINFGGTHYAWDSADEIALWVFTGLLLPAFALTQWWHPLVAREYRLYPAQLLGNWRFIVLQVCAFSGAGVTYIPIYYIPLFFQFARGEASLEAAVRLLPFVFMVVVFSLGSGYLMSKAGYIIPWFIGGSALGLIGSVLLYTLDTESSASRVYGYSVIVGIGGGCYLMSSFGAAPAVVKADEALDAVGALSVAQGMGLVFFVSVAGIIYQNLGYNFIAPLVPAELLDDARDLLAGSSSNLFASLDPDTGSRVTAAIVKALDNTYLPAVAVACLSFLCALTLGAAKVPKGTVVAG
ncbi:putative efflux pump antibiotic resistance [Diplodia seriata]|uniref:Putative efflux pump antibiotic resistance n=1 Tax=Diplodia seriata TaxID=420778 RepID=A0A0G2G0Q9_9PEZI|nr:putative efflux pump antibiotic resistance [Diplodia seriata]